MTNSFVFWDFSGVGLFYFICKPAIINVFIGPLALPQGGGGSGVSVVTPSYSYPEVGGGPFTKILAINTYPN